MFKYLVLSILFLFEIYVGLTKMIPLLLQSKIMDSPLLVEVSYWFFLVLAGALKALIGMKADEIFRSKSFSKMSPLTKIIVLIQLALILNLAVILVL